ncbi:MAG: MFS transporter [Dehalococcoidia bacterium]
MQNKITKKLGAFSNSNYRRYWFGSLASVGSIQMAVMAQGWLIVDSLGGSALSLGYLGAASSIPTILINLFGGVLADRIDRRKLIMVISGFASLVLLVLAVLDSTNYVKIWHVILLASIQAFVMGFDGPVRSSFFPLLIERKHMMSAVALGSIMWQFSRLVTPVLGGIIIRYSDTYTVFYIAVLGWITMFIAIYTIKLTQESSQKHQNVFTEINEGIRFIASRTDFKILIGLTYSTHFFGFQYLQLMPLFAQKLGRDADGFGLLLSSTGLGSLLGTLIVGKIRNSDNVGKIMLIGSLFFCLSISIFSLVTTFYIALVFLFIGGACNTIFFVMGMTVLQVRVPEHIRGRVMGIYTITFSLIPLGGLMSGIIANLFDITTAVLVGTIVLGIIFLLVFITQPTLRNLSGSSLEK